MRNPSFISISNAAFVAGALLLALAPLAAAERWLVPRFSSQQLQVSAMEYSIQRATGPRILLAGDSTVRNLHVRARDMDLDPEFTNVGAGGAGVKEWYYALRNALRANADVRAIVIGMAKGHGMVDINPVPPYYPFLLDFSDVREERDAGLLSDEQALRLALHSRLRLLYTKEDIVQSLVSRFLPGMSQFMMDQVLSQKIKEGELRAQSEPAADPSRRYDALEKIVNLAASKNTKVYFVLSPTTRKERETAHYREGAGIFHEACTALKLRCFDFSSKIPDRYFSPDGVHLREDFANAYKELIEDLLK